MKMKAKKILLLSVIIALTVPLCAASALETEGKISKVTVYRGQALVIRNIEIDLLKGNSEIIVTNLPASILPDSIYAQTSADLKILSVRYREQAVSEDTREEVKKLDIEIENLQREIHHTEIRKAHLDNQWDMFVKLRNFTAEAKQIDTDRGLLQYEPVQNLAEYILKKADEYIEKTLAFEDQITDLKKEFELLERKRSELTAGSSKTERQALVYVSASADAKATIELNYLVNNANWEQLYNLRANPENSTVTIEYNAVINQVSGENWDNVILSLSTAQPAMIAEPPVLNPMLVSLSSPEMQQAQQPESGTMIYDRMLTQQQLRKSNIKMGRLANEELNTFAIENQILFFNAEQKDIQQFRQQMEQISRVEGVSVTYDLPGSLTLPSRSDRQLVGIASVSAQADFTLLASPLLTDYVYLQADLVNKSDIIFLPGPSSMFRDGRFVGKGQMPLVTIGEKFTAGFGIDSQIQVAHELEDKQSRIQGGNRIDTYNYRIALSNYKNTPAKLRLLDRLPYVKDSSIKIDLTKTSIPLSEDAEYLRSEKKKGLLRWDLELEPNTIGEDATIVTYSFTTEFDRNMRLQSQNGN